MRYVVVALLVFANVAGAAEEVTFGGPETMHTIARADCPAAGVSAVWSGVTVRPERFRAYGLRSVKIQFADGVERLFRSVEGEVHAWPEIVFSPDCRRVALLKTNHGPYVIIATRALRRYLEDKPVTAHYLHEEVVCGPAFAYQDLRWLPRDEVEYRSGAEGAMRTVRRQVDLAPTSYARRRCLDPKSPFYEGSADPWTLHRHETPGLANKVRYSSVAAGARTSSSTAKRGV